MLASLMKTMKKTSGRFLLRLINGFTHRLAQLVEHNPAKVSVTGSIPVAVLLGAMLKLKAQGSRFKVLRRVSHVSSPKDRKIEVCVKIRSSFLPLLGNSGTPAVSWSKLI